MVASKAGIQYNWVCYKFKLNMKQLMWRGSFSEGRILFPEEGRESERLKECSTSEELSEIIEEAYTDYDTEAPIWDLNGCCVLDGEDISVDRISSNWTDVCFYEKYREKMAGFGVCGVYIDIYKGYSQVVEIEDFDINKLSSEDGMISYDGQELYPEDYRGVASEIALVRDGNRLELPEE
jgi:hypothetical protein